MPTARSDQKRAEAKRLLAHYLRTVWERAGLKWDADNQAEVEDIVDLLIEAATEPV